MTLSDRVKFNIRGTWFEVGQNTFLKLLQLSDQSKFKIEEAEKENSTKGEVFLERDPACFSALLHFCQYGSLHLPSGVCPQVFKDEMECWGVELSNLDNCCYNTMVTFMEDNAVLKNFETGFAFNKPSGIPITMTAWQTVRYRIWNVTEKPFSSRVAKVYFFTSLMFLTLSLFSMVVSTHPTFRRKMSKDEWKEALGNGYEDHRTWFDDYFGYSDYSHDYDDEDATSMTPANATSPSPLSTTTPSTPSADNNCTCITATTPSYRGKQPENLSDSATTPSFRGKQPENLSDYHARLGFLDYFDYACFIFFAIDFAIRLTTCPRLSRFFCSLLNVADLLALMAGLAKILVDKMLPSEKYTVSSLDAIDCLQVFRFLRFFRLVRDIIGFKVLLHSLKASTYELLLLVTFLSSGVLIFGTFAFWCERKHFGNIPEAFWWAIITMTTVGYGDMVPQSGLGKVVGSVCAISGVILIAITIPILVNNFLLFYGYSKVIRSKQKETQKRKLKAKWKDAVPVVRMSRTGSGGNRINVQPADTKTEGLDCNDVKTLS